MTWNIGLVSDVYWSITGVVLEAVVFKWKGMLVNSENLFQPICPTKLKCSMCISDYMEATFFYHGRYLKKLADDQCSLITKGSIYHIKHMSIQPFTKGVNWPEIGCLMEVCLIFTHTAFLLCRTTMWKGVLKIMSDADLIVVKKNKITK